MSADLIDLTVTELLTAFASGRATPTQAVDSCLERIEETNPAFGSVVAVTARAAYARAAVADARWANGTPRPLEGVPYGLKDLIATAGTPTTGGSRLYADHIPSADAVLERRLAEAGAVLVAKLATFEFGLGGSSTGNVPNPRDAARTAGGSSSGSGAAVALGQVPLAIGTDTAGSIRIPSAFCGISGLKATFGRVPSRGILGSTWSMSYAGPMARSVEDCARVLDVLSGPDPHRTFQLPDDGPFHDAVTRDVAGMRLARDRRSFERSMHPAVAEAYELALLEVQELGVELVDVALPHFDELLTAAWTIIYAEALSTHHSHLDRLEELDEMTAGLLGAAPFVSALDYLRALRLRRFFQGELERAMEGCDLLVTPGLTALPPVLGESMMADLGDRQVPWLDAACTPNVAFNLTGNPALVVPAGRIDGLPSSLQFVARPRDEAALLALGGAYQRATRHHVFSA
ncbi:amidase [Dactylosporangium sp. AC04546]|uniref:amidase n=1 Tax=Dactylosporangium sp. AC04546 TaxID=2862460 RepID=UPI0027DF5238|nr:amidase [Dactylosporangium sp. AC04546]WVK80676.1 amidase [Dactylosporangium sp. AC04546]